MKHVVAILALIALISGCTPSASEPCVGTIYHSAGALAPQYAWDWTLTLKEDGNATFELRADALQPDSPALYTAEFIPAADDVVTLCNAAIEAQSDNEPREGGAPTSWELDVDGRTVAGLAYLGDEGDPLLDAAINVIGRSTFDEAMQILEQTQSEAQESN